MALAIGKPHDLVLERRAVARTDAPNLAVVERRLVDVAANELVHPCRRVQRVAGDLLPVDAIGRERERHGRVVARPGARSARSRCSRRSSRGGVPVLSRPQRKPQRLQRFGQLVRRRLAGAARRPLLVADVDQAVQERAGRDHQRAATQDAPPSSSASPATRPSVDERSARPCRESSGSWLSLRSASRTHAL